MVELVGVGRVTDCEVAQRSRVQIRGLILTIRNRTETSSLSRVRDGGDPCSVPFSALKKVSNGGVFDLAVEQPQLLRKLH